MEKSETINRKNKKTQYDAIGHSYTALAQTDPSKRFIQYPEALRLIGDVKGKSVLDVGCGAGQLTRIIASRGAKAFGYDNSKEQIKLAIKDSKGFDITYLMAGPKNIEYKIRKKSPGQKRFDVAVSTLVLMYAEDTMQLEDFFLSTYRLLKDRSRFISIISNPGFTRFNHKMYNRCWKKDKDGIMVNFLDDNGKIIVRARYGPPFSKKDYEDAAKKAGFQRAEWANLNASKEGLKKMGRDYWKNYKKDCPYIGFVVTK